MLTEDRIELVKHQFSTNGKIAAIKLYREFVKCSLLDAKNQVEHIQAHGRQADTAKPSSNDFDLNDHIMDSVLDAIQEGNKIRAIKIHKDATRSSLASSKEFIENLMSELEVSVPDAVGKSGCLLLLIAVLMLSVGSLI